MADFTKDDNNTPENRRAAQQIGQQIQSTAVDQFQQLIGLWHPFFQAQSIWQKAIGHGYEAVANTMRQETSRSNQNTNNLNNPNPNQSY